MSGRYLVKSAVFHTTVVDPMPQSCIRAMRGFFPECRPGRTSWVWEHQGRERRSTILSGPSAGAISVSAFERITGRSPTRALRWRRYDYIPQGKAILRRLALREEPNAIGRLTRADGYPRNHVIQGASRGGDDTELLTRWSGRLQCPGSGLP